MSLVTQESIYQPHFEGVTVKVGVALLRVRGRTSDVSPFLCGTDLIDSQRYAIAVTARAERRIVVSEFIEYGTLGMEGTATLAAIDLCRHASIDTIYVPARRYLAATKRGWDALAEGFQEQGIRLVDAHLK